MATVADLTEINAAVDTIITDGGILHQVIHGPAPLLPPNDPNYQPVTVTVELGEINNLATALAELTAGGVSASTVNDLIANALHIVSINSFTLDSSGMLSIAYTKEDGPTSVSVDLSNLVTQGGGSSAIVMEDLTNTDLNTIITPGWYRIVSGNSNYPPDGVQGAMRVISTGTDTDFRQDYYERDVSAPHHYTRSTLNIGASWSTWKQALHTPTIGTANQVLTSTGSSYDWADPGPGTRYSAGDGLELSGTSFSLEEATLEDVGGVELATQAETATGTDHTRAVTPLGLKSVIDAIPVVDSLPHGASSGDYLRYDENGDVIWDDNPLPINNNNRLTTMDGQRIRTIGTDFIEFAVYALQDSDVVVTQDTTYNWDDTSSINHRTFTVTVPNDPLITEEWIRSITQVTVDGLVSTATLPAPITSSPGGSAFTGNLMLGHEIKDPLTSFHNGEVGYREISASVATNGALTGTPYNARATGNNQARISWRSPSAVFTVTDTSTLYIDQRRNIINARLRVSNTSNASANVAFTTPVFTSPSPLTLTNNPSFSGNDATFNYSTGGGYLYHDAGNGAVSGSTIVTYTRPGSIYQDGIQKTFPRNAALNQDIVSRGRSFRYSTTSASSTLSASDIIASSSGNELTYTSDTTRSNDTTLSNGESFSIVNPSTTDPLYYWLIFPGINVQTIDEDSNFAPSNSGAARLSGVVRQDNLMLGFASHEVTFTGFRFTIAAGDGSTEAQIYVRL